MTPDSITPTSSATPAPEPQPPATPESILATLESALAELTDLAVLIDTAKAAEAQLLKLFEIYKRQPLSPAGINDLSKAVQVLYRLTSIRKTLIITITSLIKRHASPTEAQTAIAQTLTRLRNEAQPLPAAPNNPANGTLAAELPEISEVSEIGEINEVDEIGEVDDAEEFSEAPSNGQNPATHGKPCAPSLEISPHSALRAPNSGQNPAPHGEPGAPSLELSPHSAFRTPHSSVRGVRVCPWLPGLTEKELARLVLYIGQLQAWEDRRQLWLRTPRRPPIWHPPAWGGFKLEDTRPLQFPTKGFDPNFDPCRPATWSPEMIAAEYRREIPFFPRHELLGPIPPDPSAIAPQPAADPSSADPHPTAPPPTAHSWVGDGSREADAPIEDDWDADDAWAEDESWDDATDDLHSSVPPDPG